jgi:anti-sigma factor RsiW
MDVVPSRHPGDETLNAYALGKLDEMLAEAVTEHLRQCPGCRERAAVISADRFSAHVRAAENALCKSSLGTSERLGRSRSLPWEAAAPSRRGKPGIFHQAWVLTRRYVSVWKGDQLALFALLGQSLMVA